ILCRRRNTVSSFEFGMSRCVRFADCGQASKLAKVAREIFAPISAANQANFGRTFSVHSDTSTLKRVATLLLAQKFLSGDRSRRCPARRRAVVARLVPEKRAALELACWQLPLAENLRGRSQDRRKPAAGAAELGSRPLWECPRGQDVRAMSLAPHSE